MGQGPLPPHERTWRHPSELGPTRADVDLGSPSHASALTIGALAVVAVAALVVVLSPSAASNPMAISATTTPAAVRAALTATTATMGATVTARAHTARSTPAVPASSGLASLAAYPHSVVNSPGVDLDRVSVAVELPGADEVVYVRTENVTYRMAWALAVTLDAPDGSVVFDSAGDIVGRILDGALVTLVAD